MDWHELLLTAGRAVLVYVYVLVVVRLLGKREIGNLSAFDFLVALMIGEVVDEIIYADVSLLQGAVAIAAIATLEYLNSRASYRSAWINRLTSGGPSVLVRSGRFEKAEMARERLSEEDLWSQLRIQGVEDLSEVKQATLEPDGQISVLKEDWARELQVSDLKRIEAVR